MPHHEEMPWQGFEAVAALVCICLLFLYLAAVMLTNQKYRKWPAQRLFFWAAGLAIALAAVAGPLARLAHTDFRAHMAGHLLLGMLAPLLLLYAKPMALLLRTCPLRVSRKISRLLKSRPLQFIANPLAAAMLNIGGLYVLYLTELFLRMHESVWLYALIHLHVLLAGYLFTLSILAVDITPHRYGFVYRSVILILALAAHQVLSKLIYAQPPAGVATAEGEAGALLMYYGGDAIDVLLIALLCHQWYRAASKKEEHGLIQNRS